MEQNKRQQLFDELISMGATKSVANRILNECEEAAIPATPSPSNPPVNGEEGQNWQQELIGGVKDRFEELKEKGFDWHSFYHGWLEGRFQMKRTSLPQPSAAKAEQEGSRWLPINNESELPKEGEVLIKFDTGEICEYGNEMWPFAVATHYLVISGESTTPSVKEVAYDELWDEFSEHIDDDIDSLSRVAGCCVLTERQYNKLIAKIKAAPVKEAGQQLDPVAFAEWIKEQNYKPYAGEWYLNGNNYAHQPMSTNNLLDLYLQSINKT